MPQELKKVNGRWVVAGAQQSSDLLPVARPQRQASANPRPEPQAKPKPKSTPNPFARLINDVRYELFGRPLGNPVVRYNPLAQVLRANQRGGAALSKQVALGAVGATDNALRMGYSAAQRVTGKPKANASSGAFGSALDQSIDALYRTLGAKPPSEMNADERGFDMARRSVALNVMLAPVTPTLGAASAATGVGMALRGGGAFALNEALSTFLDDNTGGNVVNLINQASGAKLPGAVDVGRDDLIDAAIKSFIPNAAASLAVGGAVGGGVSLGAKAFRNIRRNVRAHRAVQQEVQERAFQREAGLTTEDEVGTYDFPEEVRQPAAATPAPAPPAQAAPVSAPARSFAEADRAMQERLGMPEQQAQEGLPGDALQQERAAIPSADFQDPTQPGANMGAVYEPLQERPWDYDPSLPESTAVGKAINDLSDGELSAVQQGAGLPVIERINQAIEARAAVEPRPSVDAGMVMAPTSRLADDYLESITRKLEARDDYELRPLFDPGLNPALWQRAQALTGVDDAAQLSKADMLDSLTSMAADGQAPIVNRLMGGQMLPTAEIQAAPDVFQYKGGVNEAGEQIGNSLEGVERWDPNAENIIQVWRSPEDGQTYVVNGHNRLAAAKRMGIPSMRVEYLDAPTAAEARLQGAISNVSDGKGTVFDAAKLAREYGITDPAQLKALGKPGASGFWKDGMAMGRLPEDVFTAAVNEQIPLRRAVIIGESGVDEQTMRSAYRYLVQQGPDNVKEATLREMLAMAGRSPDASSADQPDILTGTEWAQDFNAGMLAKADLAGAVRLMLSKEKKLFGTVGRQAGQIERVGQVDATAAKGISGEASRALAIFDQLKYEAGPVGDLLNEGTQRVLAGEQPAAVAKGIKNRLAASIQQAMGKDVAPATDVVQEDMFGAAAKTADEPATATPVELTSEERVAAKTELIREAIANGEVRPPSAPIPNLPEPAQARLDQPIDVQAARQAIADEARLAIQHKQADAALGFEQGQALRDAADYEALSFDQKKQLGMADAIEPEVVDPGKPPSLADTFGRLMRQMAESDARLFQTIGEMQQVTRRAVDELSDLAAAPVRPEPLRLLQGSEQPELQLPLELRKASPRYGRNTIVFQSDLDRAAYVLANDSVKPSKAADKFRRVVQEAGLELSSVVAHGKRVKAALKQAAKGNPGEINLPAQPYGDVAPPPSKAGADRVRQQIEANNQAMDDIRRNAQQEGC